MRAAILDFIVYVVCEVHTEERRSTVPNAVPAVSLPENSPRTLKSGGKPIMDNSAASSRKRQSSIYWFVNETSPALRCRSSLVDQIIPLANDKEDQCLEKECGWCPGKEVWTPGRLKVFITLSF